jgi:hypothetical protein
MTQPVIHSREFIHKSPTWPVVLPHVKMRAKADSLPHMNVRA